MSKILEKIEDYMVVSMMEPTPEVMYGGEEELFNKMADFIVSLDPEVLTDEEIEGVMDIINDLEILAGTDDELELEEAAKRAKKTLASKKTYGRQWYAKNKTKVKKTKKKIEKSAEGRKRQRRKGIMLRGNKTPTGRPVRKYNTRGHTNA